MIMIEPATTTSSAKDGQKPGQPYNSIRSQMRTGDTLLFRGSDLISDTIVKIEQFYDGVNSFSHSGMVILPRDLPAESTLRRPNDQDKIYVFESTASGPLIDGVPDLVDNKGHLGVQLRDLDLVVETYDENPKTRLAWLPLQDAIRPLVTPKQLDETLLKYLGLFYDASCIDLSAAAIPCMRFIRDNHFIRHCRDAMYRIFCCGARPSSWLFCSELVAQVYISWGVFPETVIAADVMPTDFLPANFTSVVVGTSASAVAVPAGAIEPKPKTEMSILVKTETADSDHQVPWVFKEVVRFHR